MKSQWLCVLALPLILGLSACSGSSDSGTAGPAGGGTASYTVSTGVGANGAISPTSATVAEGDTTTFTITPDTAYVIDAASGCGGSLSGNTYTTGAVNADCTVTVSFARLLSAVSALFPTNGANWNDYVAGRGWSTATDTACNAATDSACVHGGAMRVVTATGKSDCTGLTAADELGAFKWICDAGTGTARLISIGFAAGKGLANLIDFTTSGFKADKVTVFENGTVWGVTPGTIWWSNPVAVNNSGGSLNTASTIYLVTSQPSPAATYTLDADKVSLVIHPGVTLSGPGLLSPAVTSLSHDYLWIEGSVNAAGGTDGVLLNVVRFSTLRDVQADNALDNGVRLASQSNHNRLSEISVSNNGCGILLQNSNHNSLSDISASNNVPTCANGIYLLGSSSNVVTDVRAADNGFSGIFANSTSINNSISGVTSSNAIVGVFLNDNSNSNTFLGMTLVNNNSSGSGIGINNGANNTFSNVAATNNAYSGINIFSNSHDNTLSNVAAANNSTYGIVLNTTSNNAFTGLLRVGSNGTADCNVSGGTNQGLDNTCANAGSSDAALTTGISLANSFVGKVITDDTQNTSDIDGAAASFPVDPAVFDWSHFDNAYRGWGKDGSAFPSADQQGQWQTGAGRIWDWSVAIGDNGNNGGAPALLGVVGLPTGNDTLTHAWSGTPASNDNAGCDAMVAGSTWNGTASVCQTTFLRNAMEIQGDGIGNDNTLCESGETCLYMPNIGSYQGHGKLISAGAFTDGTLTGITLMKYESNGR